MIGVWIRGVVLFIYLFSFLSVFSIKKGIQMAKKGVNTLEIFFLFQKEV